MGSKRRILIFALAGLLILHAAGVGMVYIGFKTGIIRVEEKLSPGVN